MQSSRASFEGSLRASHLFGRLDGAFVASLARCAQLRRVAQGEALWYAGTPAEHFVVIVRGLVEITRRSPGGSESILAIFGPRESIGDVAALGRTPYPADAVALTDAVEVLVIPADPVREAVKSTPEVAAAMNASLIEHTRALQDKIRIMTAGSVPKRLATLLLHLLDRFGDFREDGAAFIPVSLSRAQVARLIGARVETTIRAMSRWQKAGLVTTSSEGFTIRDPRALAALVDDAGYSRQPFGT